MYVGAGAPLSILRKFAARCMQSVCVPEFGAEAMNAEIEADRGPAPACLRACTWCRRACNMSQTELLLGRIIKWLGVG